MLNTTTEIPMQLCPTCGYTSDSATALEDGKRPKVGDFTVCINCAGVMRFGSDLQLVPSSSLEAGPVLGGYLQVIVDGIKTLHGRGDRPKQSDQEIHQ